MGYKVGVISRLGKGERSRVYLIRSVDKDKNQRTRQHKGLIDFSTWIAEVLRLEN